MVADYRARSNTLIWFIVISIQFFFDSPQLLLLLIFFLVLTSVLVAAVKLIMLALQIIYGVVQLLKTQLLEYKVFGFFHVHFYFRLYFRRNFLILAEV